MRYNSPAVQIKWYKIIARKCVKSWGNKSFQLNFCVFSASFCLDGGDLLPLLFIYKKLIFFQVNK